MFHYHSFKKEFRPRSKIQNGLTPEEQMINSMNNGYVKIRRIKRLAFQSDMNSIILTTAIQTNQSKKIIEFLIDCGCDTRSYDHYGDNAFTLAIRENRLDIFMLLLKQNNYRDTSIIDAPAYNGVSPLMIACSLGNETMVRELIGNNAKFNKQYDNGNTALHYAVKANRFTIVKLLLEHGANVNTINNFNETPLCYGNNYDIIKVLLRYNSNPNHTDNMGNTLLHRLVKYNSISCIKLLVDYHSNPLISNKHHMNVIEYARAQSKQAIVDILTKYSKFIKKKYTELIETILTQKKQEQYLDKIILSYLF